MTDIKNLITDNIDLWASAIKKRSSQGRGSSKKIELAGIKKLRELILELAVRGKLVPQDANDEPASVLLDKILEKKALLITDKKVKKEKSLPAITDEETLFHLPKGWSWSRLGNAGETNVGLTYSPKDTGDIGTPVLRSTNVQKGKIDLNDLVRVDVKVKDSAYVNDGDLLICARNGSKALVGKTALITGLLEPMAFGAFMAIYRSRFNQYFEKFINSPVFRRNLEGVSTTTINQITQGNLRLTIAPVPPLAEQQRIVAKVDELMALCDELEQQTEQSLSAHQTLVEVLLGSLFNNTEGSALTSEANDNTEALTAMDGGNEKNAGAFINKESFQTSWQRIAEHFDVLFTTEHSIEQLKQTILQLAVMGKLVPQDPNDEPASVLLEKIAAEKAQLIADKVIKKQKPLPAITDEEKPFCLPKGWMFSRLEQMASLITKGSSPKWQGVSYTEDPTDILFVTSENVGAFKLKLDKKKFVEKKFNAVEPRSILKKDDFLMNIVGASIGRTATYDVDELANINQAVCLIRSFPSLLCGNFFLTFFNSDICISYMYDKQVDNARPNLSMANIAKFVIPVPPLAEQYRIVAKVDELMTLCEQLKTRLANAHSTQLHLADAVVEKALIKGC